MSKISVVHLGHSHLAALTSFLYGRKEDDVVDGQNEIRHFIFNTKKYNVFGTGSDRYAYGHGDDTHHSMNPEVLGMIERLALNGDEVMLVSSVGGNVHNALTLLEIPGGIDVVLPQRPDLPVLDGAEVIPYNLLKSLVERRSKEFFDDLRGIRASIRGRMLHVISPPPIESDQFILKFVSDDPYFSQYNNKSITPAIVRYKMWLLHCSIYEDLCAEAGVEIIQPPSGCVVDGMWLSPECMMASDPTHANSVYGGHVLEAIEDALGGCYRGWNWLE